MGDWRTMSFPDWNKRLIEHFFCRTHLDDEPVVALDATPDALTAAVGCLGTAPPSEVRDRFVESVLGRIKKAESLLGNASDYPGYPQAPSTDGQPPFFAHLFFTCIAASESTDELANEQSFVARLRTLSGDWLPEHSIAILPRLWEYFRDWLNSNRSRYRELRLPDQGALKRIGYTVRLSFPDRRDQKKLSELLARVGLIGAEPMPEEVLELVRANRTMFRRAFLDAADVFRDRYRAAARDDRLAASVFQDRFWAAVRDAARRGRAGAGAQASGGSGPQSARFRQARVELVMSLLHGRMRLLLVCQDPSAGQLGPDWSTSPLDISGESYGAVFATQGDRQDFDEPVRRLLAGEVSFSGLTPCVACGLVLFGHLGPEYFSVFNTHHPQDATHILCRASLAQDLRSFLRPRRGSLLSSRPSAYEGWVQFNECTLSLPAADATPPSLLAVASNLRPPFRQQRIRVVGGIRVDDGFLGIATLLPLVVVDGAVSVTLRTVEPSDATEPLSPAAPSEWHLGARDIEGEFILEACLADTRSVLTSRLRFYQRAQGFSFKGLSREQAAGYFMEGTTSDVAELDAATVPRATHDHAEALFDILYIGPRVGEVHAQPKDGCTWRVSVAYGYHILEYLGESDKAAQLVSEVCDDSRAVRFWRRLFSGHLLVTIDPPTEEVRHEMRRWGEHGRRRDLTRVGEATSFPPAGAAAAAGDPTALFKAVPVAGPPPGSLLGRRLLTRRRRGSDIVPENRPPSGQGVEAFDATRPHPSFLTVMDVIAARAERVQALAAGELKEIALALLGSGEDFGLYRDVTRAWVETGVFDRIHRRSWSGTSFLPRRPRFVMFRVGRRVQATMMGVSPGAIRDRLNTALRRQDVPGIRALASESPNQWVGPLPRISAPNEAAVGRLSELLRCEPPEWLPPVDALPFLSDVVKSCGDPPPGWLDFQRFDWVRGYFVNETSPATERDGIELRRCIWGNAPDHFVVVRGGAVAWWTRSRTWAALYALSLQGRPSILADGDGRLRSVRPGIYLPVGAARILAAYGPDAPGRRQKTSTPDYYYPCPTWRLATAILQRFSPARTIT